MKGVVESQMAMLMIPLQEWKNQQARLERVEGILTEKNQGASVNEWMDSNSARLMLGVSPKTWQQYRDKRIIPFAQFGRKIMVRRSDVEAFLAKHFITK